MRALVAAAVIAVGLAGASEPAADPWAKFLTTAVNAAGEVAYRSLERAQRTRIDQYLDDLGRQDVSRFGHDPTVAFWLNAYHALVISAVLHGEDPDTLRGRARMYHWFGHVIAGRRRTLDDVRAILDTYASTDPRIHLAICDGTRGGARLMAEPYEADRLDAQLAAAARRFVNNGEKLRVAAPGRLELSRVFSWYRSDFEREAGSLVDFLRPLIVDGELRRALDTPPTEIVFLRYDWQIAAARGEPVN